MSLESYDELWQWSIDNIAKFWGLVWEYCGIIHSQPYSCVQDIAL
jgi:acetoacetyl-CoA synthetase